LPETQTLAPKPQNSEQFDVATRSAGWASGCHDVLSGNSELSPTVRIRESSTLPSKSAATPALPSLSERDSVIHWLTQVLFAADISFRRQNGCVAEQKLDLFELTSRCVAPPRTAATKIVRSKLFNPSALRALLHYIPNHVLRKTTAPDGAILTDRAEQGTFLDARCRCPCVNPVLNPRGDRNGTNMPGLADEIDNSPMPLAALDPFARQTDRFGATQTAPQQEG
jgi:hypothetical protein